jgi:bacillithiol system protein YtxJ
MTPSPIKSQTDLDQLLAASATRPVFLFKHSTRCPVSFTADDAYRAFAADQPADAPVLFGHLDLIRYREVSNAIADSLGVYHQSPQAILVVDGRATWHASHYDITPAALAAALAALAPD